MLRTDTPTATEAPILRELADRFRSRDLHPQPTCDGIPTVWVEPEHLLETLHYVKAEAKRPYRMLYDLTAIDERTRTRRDRQPAADFTVVYHLLSFDRNEDLRVKVALSGLLPTLPSITGLWPNANWYEREVWDMFGVSFAGHPHLKRILTPPNWTAHPLRKDHFARATEMGVYDLSEEKEFAAQEALRFNPEEWGMSRHSDTSDFMFLNLGPNHPSVHGVFRLVLQLEGEEIVGVVPEIGFHHRGAEKMGERQSWHTFIPYTDRIDYLSGVMNNFPYVMAVESLAGIAIPPRAQMIRIMLAELFRIISHLVFFGTMSQDVGQLSPVFYMFTDRERAFEIVEAICGFRMHPAWFRIGGVAADLPQGWDRLIRNFCDYLPKRLDEYETLVMKNRIFKARTIGVGAYTVDEAIEWGVTGPGLRACGLDWDWRKSRPYSGYDQLEFDVPTCTHGDCYDRVAVHIAEMRQSLRILRQCLTDMPGGPYKSDHRATTPPRKERTMQDIETLINHFVNVSWGPVIPPGEVCTTIEASKGMTSYYLISDGDTMSYRTRIRTPSFPHLQMIPLISRGSFVADLIALIGSIDFVMADVDR
ncbi:NADH-quinone oxidoreductase subunit C/D [Acidisoma sp.]|uniref:NADH-quinone oxidoreductase subunit C/D n=1 Tax=Acidisoma sp. TaxID=1872115 RepID=UPI0038D0B733